MIISDLDYLEFMSETHAMQLNGGAAIASSEFFALAFGNSTNTSTIAKNLAINDTGDGSVAISFIKVTSIASGGNTFASSSASSYSVTEPI